MKHLIKSVVLSLSVFVLLIGTNSCEPDIEEKLTIMGSWKVQLFESVRINPEGREIKSEWDVSEYNFVTIFRADGTYRYCLLTPANDGETSEFREDILRGTWSYENNILTMTSEYGSYENYQLIKLEENELVMQSGVADDANPNENITITMYMTRLTNFIEEEFGNQE